MQRYVTLPLLLFVACSLGCRKSDDPRNIHIKGVVTLNGEPIHRGKITFSPAEGNQGPAGIASIMNGKYKTRSIGGKGTVGGMHRVDIENFVKAPGDGEEELIEGEPIIKNNPLPKSHKEMWDIPKTSSGVIEKNFDVVTEQ